MQFLNEIHREKLYPRNPNIFRVGALAPIIPRKLPPLAHHDGHNGQDGDFTVSRASRPVLARQQLRPAPRCLDGK